MPSASAATAIAVEAGALAEHAEGMAQIGEQVFHIGITIQEPG